MREPLTTDDDNNSDDDDAETDATNTTIQLLWSVVAATKLRTNSKFQPLADRQRRWL